MSRFLRIVPLLAVVAGADQLSLHAEDARNRGGSDVQSAAGAYPVAQNVTIATATEGAEIRYTTDGTDPSATNGTVYTGRSASRQRRR